MANYSGYITPLTFAALYYWRKHEQNVETLKAIISILAGFVLISCQKTPVSAHEESGKYVFVEMLLFSSAREIEGHCDVAENPEPDTFYDYNKNTGTLEYWLSPEFPVNNDLQMIFGMKHYFNPLAGAGGALIDLVPVYFVPDYLNSNAAVSGIDPTNSVSLNVRVKSFVRTVTIPVDSVFLLVTRILEEGVVEESLGDTCIWEYTDSLAIANYGLHPHENIRRKQFP